MLGDATVCATIAVSDIEDGKEFYGKTLGLTATEEDPGGVVYASGEGKLYVYESSTAGTGQATCASWKVKDIKSTMDTLTEAGVEFDQYDIPGVTYEGDVAVMGGQKSAWFKDPDGNILNITSGS